jgi:hypothetical protein
MRPVRRQLLEPMDPRRHPPLRADARSHRLSELIVRVEQVAQRLQRFQHRYRTPLSHADQGWLHQAQQQVAFYLAALSRLEGRRAVAPGAPAPFREVAALEPLAGQLLQLAQATAPMAQIRPVPRQETRRRGRAAAGGRARRSASRSPGVVVHAILIVLARHATQAAHEEAADGAASGPANAQRGSSADPGAGTPAGQTRHDAEGSARRFVPLYEACVRPHHADPGIGVRRSDKMPVEKPLELLRRLRRRIARL